MAGVASGLTARNAVKLRGCQELTHCLFVNNLARNLESKDPLITRFEPTGAGQAPCQNARLTQG